MTPHDGIRRRVTERIIDALESGEMPWRKPWVAHPNAGTPCDLAGTQHRGVNALLLQAAASESGFRSRWWDTFEKWRSLGCRPKPIPFGGTRAVALGGTLRGEEIAYSAEQVEGPGVEQYLVPTGGRTQVDWGRAERVVAGSGAKIDFVFGTYAAYHRPPHDRIIFPLKQQFEQGRGGLSGYYDSLFHELLHWTEARLLWCPHSKWNETTRYAINELRAEMGAGWLATAAGIPNSEMDSNHNKYVDRWLWAMREDPGLVFEVAHGASLGVEYLLRIDHPARKARVEA